MAISLNGNASIQQPSKVKEGTTQKVVQRTSLSGVIRRFFYAQKKEVQLTFSGLNQSQYSQIVGYFYGTASPVAYLNSISGFSFTGFATATEAEYYVGASMLRDLTMTIIEK